MMLFMCAGGSNCSSRTDQQGLGWLPHDVGGKPDARRISPQAVWLAVGRAVGRASWAAQQEGWPSSASASTGGHRVVHAQLTQWQRRLQQHHTAAPPAPPTNSSTETCTSGLTCPVRPLVHSPAGQGLHLDTPAVDEKVCRMNKVSHFRAAIRLK